MSLKLKRDHTGSVHLFVNERQPMERSSAASPHSMTSSARCSSSR